MKLLAAIAAACLCASAFGQSGVRYDQRVSTVATNVPSGAAANVMAIPNSVVTICMDGNCFTAASIFSDQGLTVPASNPMKTNGQGFFGFYAAAGSYFYKVVLPSGTVQGIYPFTLGGSGTAGITALTGDVIASGPGSTSSALAAITTAGTCGDATHVGQITKDTKGRVTGCTPVAITGGSAPAGTNNDLQIFGTSSTLAADTGNLTNNSTTHNFHQKQLNGIPYAGNYSTGSNGIPNAFAATGAGVIINDSENAGDTTAFGGNNTTIFDMSSTGLGARLHNCAVNLFTVPSRVGVGNCWSDLIYTDVPTTSNGQGGQPFHALGTFTSGPGNNNGPLNLAGGGLTVGDSGWAFDSAENIAVDAYRNGISNAIEINSNSRKNGDIQNFESRLWCRGGNTEAAGEGCVNISLQGGQDGIWPSGTVTATTGTGDIHPTTTANKIAVGGMLLDTRTARATGTLVVEGTTPWAESTYLNKLATAGGLTPSTADCVSIDPVHTSTVAGTPQSVTITCTVGTLGRLSTGIAYFASNATPEQVTITAAPAPVGGVQTLTLLAYLPHAFGSNLIQGGTFGCLSFDANLSISGRSSYYVFGSSDSTHMVYGMLIHGSMSGNFLPMLQAEPETLSTPSNGYHVYPCAQVAYVDADSPGAAFHLEQNNIPFANGDTVEFPNNPAVQATQLALDQTQFTPASGGGSNSIHAGYSGAGVTANYFPFTLRNGNDPAMYVANGGWASAPTAINIFGPHSRGISFSNPMYQSLFTVNDSSTSHYDFLESSAGGTITINGPAHQYEFSAGLLVGGNLGVNNNATVAGHFSTGDITTQNVPSDTNPPLTLQEQYVTDNSCRGEFFTMTPGPTTFGRICAYHFNPGGNAYGLAFDVGPGLTRALSLTIDPASALHAIFPGDVSATTGTFGSLTSPVNIKPIGSFSNGTITFGQNFGNPAVTLFDGGAANRYGFGMNAAANGEFQFFIGSTPTNDHFSWNKGGDFQPMGTNELMRLLATGNLLIGTATDNGVDKLQVNGSISTTGPITVGGTGAGRIQIGTNVFSALAACAGGTEGTQAPVTDSTTATWGATITGSGTNHVLAYCDGTAWTVMAK